jgi:hypothetical protein
MLSQHTVAGKPIHFGKFPAKNERRIICEVLRGVLCLYNLLEASSELLVLRHGRKKRVPASQFVKIRFSVQEEK